MEQTFIYDLADLNCQNLVTQWSNDLYHIENFRHSKYKKTYIRPLNIVEKKAHLTLTNQIEDICTICVQPIRFKNKVYQLNCVHRFHKNCLDHWFNLSSDLTCPLCRQSQLFEQPVNRIFSKGKIVQK